MSNDVNTLQKEIDKLKAELSQHLKQRYGLIWKNVPEAFDDDAENKLPILTEVKDLAIKNDDGKPTHILIEGDNYHALTCLNYTHNEAVDVIYIDPPYNTGNDGFRYKDKRTFKKFPNGEEVAKNHPQRHSFWLSFMSKRLELAKNLLKDTGVIFISIDDNEVAQLKLLCDGIFGEENFVQDLIWQNKYTVSNDAKFFSKQHDYILCYAKSISKIAINLLEKTDEAKARYRNIDNDSRGAWKATPLDARSGTVANIFEVEFENGIKWKPTEGRFSVYSKQKLIDLYNDNRLWFGKDGCAKPSKKSFLSEVASGMKCGSILGFDLFGHTHKANDQLAEILGKATFASPKPIDLILKLIQLTNKPDTPSVILDFFAGSGTTAQAVMELNKEDGGNRQCILVTNNENEICTKVCYPRVQRVIGGYPFSGNKETVLFEKNITWTDFKKNIKILERVEEIEQVNRVYPEYDDVKKEIKDGKLKVVGVKKIEDKTEGLGNSLKYYRTDFVGKHHAKEATDSDKTELAHKAGYLLAIAENTLEEVEATNFYQFFTNNREGSFTAVYFKENLEHFDTFCEKIAQLNKPVAVYVFDWGNGESFESYFEDMSDVEVKALPNPIVSIYKAIFQAFTIPETETEQE